MISSIVLPIILFGILVFIHELGHFVVAKISDVHVERFALGFGPALFKKKVGETEYAVCALPLGGYVKMLGEEVEKNDAAKPESLDPRSFAAKKPLTRIGIVAMGPVSNLLLPIVLFGALFMFGVPTPISQVGHVVPGYPAAQAGLRPGDEILAVQGRKVWKWTELTEVLGTRANQPTEILIEREGKKSTLSITPVGEEDTNLYGQKVIKGKIGIDLYPHRPAVGILSPESHGAKAGLETGDVIAKVNGTDVHYWWQFEDAYENATGVKKLSVERFNEDGVSKTFEAEIQTRTLSAAGMLNGDLFLRKVVKDSVAEQKGLQAGDRLVSINEVPLGGWITFQKMIQDNKGEAIVLKIQRGTKLLNIELIPKEVIHKDEMTKNKHKRRQLGVVSASIGGPPAFVHERYLNPFKALKKGVDETIDISVTTVMGLVKLVRGQLSVDTLGGPISIFYLAGSSYKAGGWVSFIRMMAILSITLGILNFLPIPILDGGHLFFFVIELIKGSPVHVRVREFAQQLGLVLIIGLMILVFYVDINRYFVDSIKAFFSSN